MQRIALALLCAASLLLACAIPVAAENPTTLTASVTVTSYINFVVNDSSSQGINFGSHAAGSGVVPDSGQDDLTPAVILTVMPDTNAAVNVQLKATGDFTSGSNSIPIGNAKWAKGTSGGTRADMTTDFVTVQSVPDSDSSVQIKVWHFLQMPESATAGTYQTTFVYQAS